jgi:hypothetical protein
VALKSVLSFDFTGTRKLKTLFGTGFCFHLRHLVPIYGLSRLLSLLLPQNLWSLNRYFSFAIAVGK